MNINSVGSGSITFDNLASGKRINKAADDASGMSVAEKLRTQSNGYDVGGNNALAGKNVIDVADGAMKSIGDSLQRIRDLAVTASSSALMTDDDKSAIQSEIDSLKQGIQDTAKNTSFNTMSLLDGSTADMKLATNPDGRGQSIKLVNGTLESLGIADFSVMGEFDISSIDSAIESVSNGRSQMGAQSNAISSSVSYNAYASENLTNSRSRIEDLDMADGITEVKKNEILEQYKILMEKKKMDENEKANFAKTFFN